jgi:hypothetical protein
MSIQVAFWLMVIPVVFLIGVIIRLMVQDTRREE